MLVEEGQYLVVEQIRPVDKLLGNVQFGESNRRAGVDECLLVNASSAFEGADVERT